MKTIAIRSRNDVIGHLLPSVQAYSGSAAGPSSPIPSIFLFLRGGHMSYTTAGNVKFRARRSCLSVPASSPKMLGKIPTLGADEVFMDLEDSVAPGEKEAARKNVVAALREQDNSDKTIVLRINGVYTHWCYRDILEIIEEVGQKIDCIMIPKVQWASDVTFV